MLYRGMDRAALDAAYNNSAAVGLARREEYVAGWAKRSAAFRKARGGRIDLRYGTGARQRLDVFPCGTPGAPTLVYIHGGYWQTNDKEPYAFVGEGLLPAGFNLALIEYTLAPAARLDAIVSEVRAAVAWVIDHAKEHGGDPARVTVSGHSAGGHLTAVAMDDPRVAGGVAISGIYDLEPIRLNYLNEKLGLDPAETARNSPILHLPARAAPLVVTVGLGNPIAAGRSPLVSRSAPSTINVIVVVDADPSPAALVNAALTVTEVKTATLAACGVRCADGAPASGTSTDAVAVAATGRGRSCRYGGPVSDLGWVVARAARAALEAGIRRWAGDHA
jgi:acetyl esterase/lipase